MKFSELIKKDRIFILKDVPVQDKYDILEFILKKTLENTKYSKFFEPIRDSLIEREKAMTTAIGGGVSIPHCNSEYVDEVIASLTVLHKSVDFESMDHLPVNIIVLILIAKNNFDIHIKALASVAKFFQNQDNKIRIMNGKNIDEIYNIILNQ